MAAYDRKDFAACAQLFEQASDRYGAACCHAQAGASDAAFAALARAIDEGAHVSQLDKDGDLDPLHADARWQRELDHLAARTAEHRKVLNAELARLYDEDQGDRAMAYDKIDWAQVNPRDEARRKRVDEIIAAGGARAADDYYHAAMVYQHGNKPDEIQRAHDLAVKAVELDPSHDSAKWLAAAAEDRKLMYEYKPQKWGTQYKKIDGKWVVWPVDPAITDEQRDAWNVPPLAEAQAQAARLNAPKP
jgi:ketosteroid isomerase-like protein